MSTFTIIVFLALIGVGGYAAAKWAFRKDTEIEERRRGAARLAGVLSGKGMRYLPEFLISYSVGDYSGMGNDVKRLATLFLDGEDAVLKEFEAVFENLLTAKLQTPVGRAYVAAKLTDAADYDRDPSVVTEAPLPTTN